MKVSFYVAKKGEPFFEKTLLQPGDLMFYHARSLDPFISFNRPGAGSILHAPNDTDGQEVFKNIQNKFCPLILKNPLSDILIIADIISAAAGISYRILPTREMREKYPSEQIAAVIEFI